MAMSGRSGPLVMTQAAAELDLWAPVGYEALPRVLVEAFERADWPTVKTELQSQLDGIITDGQYGRQLQQLVRHVPFGNDTILDRYRGQVDIDYGDWDDLKRYIAIAAEPPGDLIGLSKVITAPIDATTLPDAASHWIELFKAYHYALSAAAGPMRQRIRRMHGRYLSILWTLDYVSTNRYLRYRGLHDAAFGAASEARAGRLPVASALAREAQSLGLDSEPLHLLAQDVEVLAQAASGSGSSGTLATPRLLAGPVGMSPYGTWEVINWLMPILFLYPDAEVIAWCARLCERAAARVSSPRALLQAQTWRIAADLIGGERAEAQRALPGVLALSHRAAPGLRAFPELLRGLLDPREATFALAERLARRSGNVALEISCLAWMLSVSPAATAGKRLLRLLRVTGWRKPVLVPADIAAEAAIGLVTLGFRDASIVELAAASARPSVTLLVASRHLDDARASDEAKAAAVDALGRLDTSSSREVLTRVARGHDAAARKAHEVLGAPHERHLLSEREAEVLDLAGRGLTNKQIGQQLFLSQHTVARHLANARGKLGAANRTEAVLRMVTVPPKAS
jgi:DNA-binding NarL/FixJ family response regulator